jgi:hypothetical protein
VACNRLDKIFIVNSSYKSCANLSIPEFLLLLFQRSFYAIFCAWLDSLFLDRLAPDFFEGIMDGCLAHIW